MDFENPRVPEGINVTAEHPLKNLLYLFLGVAGTIVIVFLILFYSIGIVAKWIPFETEVRWAKNISSSLDGEINNDRLQDLLFPDAEPSLENNSQQTQRAEKVAAYLQDLSDQLSEAQGLPEAIKITVHYVDKPVINAFATLGGHVFIYQGLIDTVTSENALAMVLAHEIAHIKYRHPIVAMSRGVGLDVFLSIVAGVSGDSLAISLAGNVNLLTSLAFSRGQETQSDTDAYKALLAHYGHGLGATELFSVLANSEKNSRSPEFLNSHPLSEHRVERLNELGESIVIKCAKVSLDCPLTALPEFIKSPVVLDKAGEI